MNYNEMFRVFDNGGETVDRYTVFLGNEPEEGALGLSDDPTNPSYGFSQFGDFDIDVVEKNNTEISFDQLPKNVQQHVLDRFELTEGEEFTVDDMWHGVISSILDEDKETAAAIIKEIVVNKFDELVNTPLNELNMGKIKFVGDDVYVNNKKVGSIENDLEDHSRGIVLKLDSGEEHDFDQIDDLMNFIMDTFRITEFNEGPIQVRGDYVFVNGKKVGRIQTDLDNEKSGIRLILAKGEGYEFESMPQLYKFLQGKFNVREEFISEATLEQKAVVKALRQLARKLEIPNPRFRSLGGKAGFVEMSPKNWRDEVIPNDLRKKAVVKVFNAVPSNFSDVDYGNVRRESITLTVPQWKQLLSYYGIEVPETLGEGYTIMPAIDKDRYPDREHQGLEGPFRARNGKVVYYDPKEGKYYDPDSDLYLEFGEWETMNKPRDENGMFNENANIEEALNQIFSKMKSFVGKIHEFTTKTGRQPRIDPKVLKQEMASFYKAQRWAKTIGNKGLESEFAKFNVKLEKYIKTGSEEDLNFVLSDPLINNSNYEEGKPDHNEVRNKLRKTRKDMSNLRGNNREQ